jgi:hypothetical protein
MRHTRLSFKKAKKEATPSKLRAAENRLKKERESLPLLRDWVTQQQPTAAEKVDRQLDGYQRWCQHMRDNAASSWLTGRGILNAMPPADKARFLEFWNNSSIPASHEYFCDALHRFQQGKI